MVPEMQDLKGQICVVSGSSSGIGREIALEISRCGATVVCAARRAEKLDETIALIKEEGGVAEALACDFLDSKSVEALADYTVEKYGRIDLWVNAVGVNNAMGITWDIDFEDWMMEVRGILQTCQIGTKCAINVMKNQTFGRIINMSGGGVVRAETYNSAYSCAKTAVVRFTECVSLELKAEKLPIKIFAFGPGLVRTQRTIDLANDPATKRFMPRIIDKILNDEATPINKPAKFVTFIASGAVDALEGCLLATHMNKEELVEKAEEFAADGTYKIHVKGSK